MKILLYCTKGKLSLRKSIKDKDYYLDNGSEFNIIPKEDSILNGKIVAECDFEVEEIFDELYGDLDWQHDYLPTTNTMSIIDLERESCLDREELCGYHYAIHLKNLHIFYEPREIGKLDQVNNCCFEKEVDKDWEGLPIYACVFTNGCRYQSDGHTCDKHFYPLKRIHNMSTVYDNIDYERKYVISLSPQEMCRIANKEQTTLVRNKVLKEVLE